jgi:hypothetical protein
MRRYYGLDLSAAFRRELPVDECWDLLMHAPRDSPIKSALFADPETVLPDEAAEPTLAEYSPEVEAIAALHDVNAAILAHLSAFTSKRPVRLKPYRRPGEARRAARRERLRQQARQEWAELCAQLGVTT